MSDIYLYGIVGVSDDCDEKAEDHVDKERDKGIEVNSAENPHQAAFLLHVFKGGKHVISIDQGEQTLWHCVQGAELKQMVKEEKHYFDKLTSWMTTPEINLLELEFKIFLGLVSVKSSTLFFGI